MANDFSIPPDLGGIIEKLMADGELSKMISAFAKKPEPDIIIEEPEEKDQSGTPDISSILGSLSPEMISMIPKLLSLMQKKSSASEEKHPANDSEKRKRLLLALKPYLSENRRQAIDILVTVSDLGELKNIIPSR